MASLSYPKPLSLSFNFVKHYCSRYRPIWKLIQYMLYPTVDRLESSLFSRSHLLFNLCLIVVEIFQKACFVCFSLTDWPHVPDRRIWIVWATHWTTGALFSLSHHSNGHIVGLYRVQCCTNHKARHRKQWKYFDVTGHHLIEVLCLTLFKLKCCQPNCMHFK